MSFIVNGMINSDHPLMDVIVASCKEILENLVIKDEVRANSNETTESLEESDLFIACKDGSMAISYFPGDILAKYLTDLGMSPDQVRAYADDPTSIPSTEVEDIREYCVNRYINEYVEKNNYYRMLNGLPKYGTDEYNVYIDYETYGDQIDKDSATTDFDFSKPIHEYPITHITTLETLGILDDIINKYITSNHTNRSEYRYLQYLGGKKIDIYSARITENWGILYLPPVDQLVASRFKELYTINRDLYESSVDQLAYSVDSDHYSEMVMFMIVCQTVADMITDTPEWYIRRDILDLRSVRYFLESQGVEFFEDIPMKYQVRIVKSLNKLIKFKSTTKNINDILELFAATDTTIYHYYLLKKYKKTERDPQPTATGIPDKTWKMDNEYDFYNEDDYPEDINDTGKDEYNGQTVTDNEIFDFQDFNDPKYVVDDSILYMYNFGSEEVNQMPPNMLDEYDFYNEDTEVTDCNSTGDGLGNDITTNIIDGDDNEFYDFGYELANDVEKDEESIFDIYTYEFGNEESNQVADYMETEAIQEYKEAKRVVKDKHDNIYQLEFVKVPIEDQYDNYIKNSIYRENYDTVVKQDKYWDGTDVHSLVRNNHLEKDFTIEGTKYLGLEYNVSLEQYNYQRQYYLGMIFNNKINMDDITISVPSIKQNAYFSIRNIFIFLYCCNGLYSGEDIDVNDPSAAVIARTDPKPDFEPYLDFDGGQVWSGDGEPPEKEPEAWKVPDLDFGTYNPEDEDPSNWVFWDCGCEEEYNNFMSEYDGTIDYGDVDYYIVPGHMDHEYDFVDEDEDPFTVYNNRKGAVVYDFNYDKLTPIDESDLDSIWEFGIEEGVPIYENYEDQIEEYKKELAERQAKYYTITEVVEGKDEDDKEDNSIPEEMDMGDFNYEIHVEETAPDRYMFYFPDEDASKLIIDYNTQSEEEQLVLEGPDEEGINQVYIVEDGALIECGDETVSKLTVNPNAVDAGDEDSTDKILKADQEFDFGIDSIYIDGKDESNNEQYIFNGIDDYNTGEGEDDYGNQEELSFYENLDWTEDVDYGFKSEYNPEQYIYEFGNEEDPTKDRLVLPQAIIIDDTYEFGIEPYMLIYAKDLENWDFSDEDHYVYPAPDESTDMGSEDGEDYYGSKGQDFSEGNYDFGFYTEIENVIEEVAGIPLEPYLLEKGDDDFGDDSWFTNDAERLIPDYIMKDEDTNAYDAGNEIIKGWNEDETTEDNSVSESLDFGDENNPNPYADDGIIGAVDFGFGDEADEDQISSTTQSETYELSEAYYDNDDIVDDIVECKDEDDKDTWTSTITKLDYGYEDDTEEIVFVGDEIECGNEDSIVKDDSDPMIMDFNDTIYRKNYSDEEMDLYKHGISGGDEDNEVSDPVPGFLWIKKNNSTKANGEDRVDDDVMDIVYDFGYHNDIDTEEFLYEYDYGEITNNSIDNEEDQKKELLERQPCFHNVDFGYEDKQMIITTEYTRIYEMGNDEAKEFIDQVDESDEIWDYSEITEDSDDSVVEDLDYEYNPDIQYNFEYDDLIDMTDSNYTKVIGQYYVNQMNGNIVKITEELAKSFIGQVISIRYSWYNIEDFGYVDKDVDGRGVFDQNDRKFYRDIDGGEMPFDIINKNSFYDYIRSDHTILFKDCLGRIYGFNMNIDLDQLALDIGFNHSKLGFKRAYTLKDLGCDTYIVKRDFDNLTDLYNVYTNNTKCYNKLKDLYENAETRDEKRVYSYVFYTLFTTPYDMEFYITNSGDIAKTYDQVLAKNDYTLYMKYRELMNEPDPKTRIYNVRNIMNDLVDTLEYYIRGDNLKYVLSFIYTNSFDAKMHYIQEMVNFFKSWKVQFLNPKFNITVDDKFNHTVTYGDQVGEIKEKYYNSANGSWSDSVTSKDLCFAEDTRDKTKSNFEAEVIDVAAHWMDDDILDDHDFDGGAVRNEPGLYRAKKGEFVILDGGKVSDIDENPYYQINAGDVSARMDLYNLDGGGARDKYLGIDFFNIDGERPDNDDTTIFGGPNPFYYVDGGVCNIRNVHSSTIITHIDKYNQVSMDVKLAPYPSNGLEVRFEENGEPPVWPMRNVDFGDADYNYDIDDYGDLDNPMDILEDGMDAYGNEDEPIISVENAVVGLKDFKEFKSDDIIEEFGEITDTSEEPDPKDVEVIDYGNYNPEDWEQTPIMDDFKEITKYTVDDYPEGEEADYGMVVDDDGMFVDPVYGEPNDYGDMDYHKDKMQYEPVPFIDIISGMDDYGDMDVRETRIISEDDSEDPYNNLNDSDDSLYIDNRTSKNSVIYDMGNDDLNVENVESYLKYEDELVYEYGEITEDSADFIESDNLISTTGLFFDYTKYPDNNDMQKTIKDNKEFRDYNSSTLINLYNNLLDYTDEDKVTARIYGEFAKTFESANEVFNRMKKSNYEQEIADTRDSKISQFTNWFGRISPFQFGTFSEDLLTYEGLDEDIDAPIYDNKVEYDFGDCDNEYFEYGYYDDDTEKIFDFGEELDYEIIDDNHIILSDNYFITDGMADPYLENINIKDSMEMLDYQTDGTYPKDNLIIEDKSS